MHTRSTTVPTSRLFETRSGRWWEESRAPVSTLVGCPGTQHRGVRSDLMVLAVGGPQPIVVSVARPRRGAILVRAVGGPVPVVPAPREPRPTKGQVGGQIAPTAPVEPIAPVGRRRAGTETMLGETAPDGRVPGLMIEVEPAPAALDPVALTPTRGAPGAHGVPRARRNGRRRRGDRARHAQVPGPTVE